MTLKHVTREQGTNEARRQNRLAPRSINEDDLTFEVVAATETPVRRWFGNEILRCTDAAIDVSRIIGMPVLDSHNKSSINSVLGRVEAYRIESGKLILALQMEDSRDGRRAFARVQGGMINRVSVGYTIEADEESKDRAGLTTEIVTRWTPLEVSLVSVPADPNAKVRGMKDMAARKSLKVGRNVPVRNGFRTAPVDVIADDIDDDIDIETEEIDTVDDDGRNSGRRIFNGTRSRQVDQVRSFAIEAGLPRESVDEELVGVTSPSIARSRIFDLLSERSRRSRTDPVLPDHARRDNMRNIDIVEAISVRLGATPRDGGQNTLLGSAITDLARTFMEREGLSARGMSDARVIDSVFQGVRGMHTTSDFPVLFMEGANRVLLQRYSAVPSVLKQLSLKRNRGDFRPGSFVRPGEWPKLQRVTETGEIKHGTFEVENQGYQIFPYGVAMAISRVALVNDDLGALDDMIQVASSGAADTESDLFYEILSANNFGGLKLSDGKNLFHADHGNLAASGTALDVTSLSAGREAMRLQKNVNGTGNAGTIPAVIVVGPKLETVAEKIVAEIAAATSGDVNPFAGKLRVAVENRYSGSGWWLFADPQTRPAFVHGYLDGYEGPRIRTDEPFGRQGLSMSCEMDFGCGAYDYRASYRNPGV